MTLRLRVWNKSGFRGGVRTFFIDLKADLLTEQRVGKSL